MDKAWLRVLDAKGVRCGAREPYRGAGYSIWQGNPGVLGIGSARLLSYPNTTRGRGRRCAAGPARQRAKAEGRALQATRGLGRGKGVGRGAGEGRRKSRPGGVRGAGPRPGSQGLSFFF